eukprot:533017-Pelagomonas_calceolata.AAC.4
MPTTCVRAGCCTKEVLFCGKLFEALPARCVCGEEKVEMSGRCPSKGLQGACPSKAGNNALHCFSVGRFWHHTGGPQQPSGRNGCFTP